MDIFKKPGRYQPEDEYQVEAIDPRIQQIKMVRLNRLQRLEKEKRQAEDEVKKSYQTLKNERQKIAQHMMALTLLEPVLEQHYLGDGIYINNLRRWMDETQEIKPRIEQLKTVHGEHMQVCTDAQQHLLDKTQETKVVLLQTEKLSLLEETWESG